MVAIGKELKSRGFQVFISLAEPYAQLAEEAGLEPKVIVSKSQFEEMLGDPKVWTTMGGVKRVLRAMMDHFFEPHHDFVLENVAPYETILLAHPLDFASRVLREAREDVRLASVHLQPILLRNHLDPPRLTPWWHEIRKPPWLLSLAYWMADRFGIDPELSPRINALRSKYNLAPVQRIVDKWWLSPDRILALYPDWFAPHTRIYEPRLVHAGFPVSDGIGEALPDLPDGCITFTAGTAHKHCHEFFQRAVHACKELDRTGLLLSMHSENFPKKVPEHIKCCNYVPLKSLLPKCAGIVHHGGIGTTSQSLLAGVPQVIRPLAFDQFDNATRVEKLKCGVWLRKDKNLVQALSSCLNDKPDRDDSVENSCRKIALKMQDQAGALKAANEVEALLAELLRSKNASQPQSL